MKHQCRKLYLHECCTHENFDNLNRWIRQGRFPHINKSLASVPDPMCITCNFGKARRRSHKSSIGHIANGHTQPGQGVSSDGLEAGNPGRPLMTKGQPSNVRWVDHMTSFIYVTFHRSKAVNELLKSKQEFEQYAAMYNVKIKTIWADKGVYTAQAFP
jgi:hypothetical protein